MIVLLECIDILTCACIQRDWDLLFSFYISISVNIVLFSRRLVFLLQCAFKLLESCTDEGNSAVIPLTLGSAVRKFTKKALRVNHTITAHRQQVGYTLR